MVTLCGEARSRKISTNRNVSSGRRCLSLSLSLDFGLFQFNTRQGQEESGESAEFCEARVKTWHRAENAVNACGFTRRRRNRKRRYATQGTRARLQVFVHAAGLQATFDERQLGRRAGCKFPRDNSTVRRDARETDSSAAAATAAEPRVARRRASLIRSKNRVCPIGRLSRDETKSRDY